MRHILIPVLFCLAGQTLAQDGCLSNLDLGRGVEVLFDDSAVFRLQRSSNGHILVTEDYADTESDMQFSGPYGMYLTWQVNYTGNKQVPDTRIDIAFPVPLDTLPVPQDGAAWQGDTVNTFSDGLTRAERYSVRFRDPATIDLSGCTYHTLTADIRYEWPDDADGLTVTYLYLDELGAGFVVQSQMDNDKARSSAPLELRRASK